MYREVNDQSPLLPTQQNTLNHDGLSMVLTIICIIDVFGVFPIVALPKAITECGFYGILVVFVVCSVQMYTANLLGRCWIQCEEIWPEIKRKNRYPYAALIEATCGAKLATFVTFLLDLTVFGGGIPNLILASQNLQLLGLRLSSNTFDVSFCYWILLLGSVLCPVLWLGSPKDMKCLCSTSVVIVSSVFLLTLISLCTSPTMDVPPQTAPDPLWRTILLAYGILSFQFDVHPTILTIQMDMNDKTQLPVAILIAFLATLAMFTSITIVAAIKYGHLLLPSVLETLPTTITLHFAAILVALQLCLTSAISNSALYQHMEDWFGISREFNRKRCILRTILCVLAMVLAESVPKFELVMSLIGGTLTGPLVYIFPPLIFVRLAILQQNWTGNFEVFFCILIIAVGCLMTASTTYINILNTVTFANFSQPCIYNLSMTLLYQ